METIRGEYWIIDGAATYADGDIGDTNHEGYALDHLRRKVLDAADIDPGDFYDWDELAADLPPDLSGVDPEDLEQAFERAAGEDVRTYMSRKYGWIVCHRNRFAVWHLTRDAVQQIEEAVGDILFEEGFLEDGDGDAELEIYVASTGHTYEVLWSALTLGDFSALQLSEPVIGPNAQLAAMDFALVPEFYKQHPSL
jgi:hypothetical protein